MGMTQWKRIGSLVVLGLAVACGGGGGDDDDGLTHGAYWTGLDIGTSGCGSDVHEVMGGNITFPSGNKIRLELNIGATADCLAQTFTIEGTETSPGTWDMDNLTSAYACALDHDYGYQLFDLTSGTIQQMGADYELDCDFQADSGGTPCTGWFHVYMEPR